MQKPLRIALVTLNYKPYSGGVVSSLVSLTNELVNQGHQPTIVTLNFTKHDMPEEHVKRLACWGHFKYKSNPIAIPIRLKRNLMRICTALKPDIIHVHHPFILGPAAVKVARSLDVPIVFTHHSIYNLYAHYLPLPEWLVRPACTKLVNDFCATVDHIIAPSSSIKKYLSDQGITTPISIIPSSIMPLFIKTTSSKPQLGDRSIRLLSVSRFVPEKNIIWLLTAFKQLITTTQQMFILTLVGYGAWKEHLEFHAYETLKLSHQQVIFIERPSKERLVALYQDADLFVFASQSETQGIVHAEAMSQATPVVALAGPGTNDIVQSGYNGFVITSTAEFVEKITHIASDQNLFESLQQGALTTAKTYYPGPLTEQMIELYKTILKKQ